ncbi:UNVERIFIED_CONTAM: hypothetical protein PYX00_009271 [Menopon gallinae]|uniref:FYVE-type domain-containing protein n=1 Tax=Menopon gallinae TaxID=328185 RepID=A0AAW2HAY6_9NEOP
MDRIAKKKESHSVKFMKSDANSPSIMESLDSITLLLDQNRQIEDKSVYYSESDLSSQPDVTLTRQLASLNLTVKGDCDIKSFLLIDEKEHLQVSTVDQFLQNLGSLDPRTKVKVVSVFGNTGDGKSYMLNHTFFNKIEVFKTSTTQSSCTVGAWAAYDPQLKIICIDTEGLLGTTEKENQRTRLLLKILAVSDIVIYKTRAERLHRDMFTFLGSASRAFSHHFQTALQNIGLSGPLSSLGPAVMIFHETRHTKPLQSTVTESAEDILRARFAELKLEVDAFSSLRYVGVQTLSKTYFAELKHAVKNELENTAVRSPRQPSVVFQTLKVLNDKFSGEMDNSSPALFPDQYFTCPETCLSCGKRCEASMGHLKENVPHSCSVRCKYQHQYGNVQYICKSCHANGIEQIVHPKYSENSVAPWYELAKYVWSGYTIECPKCGEIYTSRQYWYGNKTPEESLTVRTEIIHVWPGALPADYSQNTAQRLVDGVTFLSEAVASVCSQPTKIISSYVADQIAPKYWRPNNEIKHCHGCKKFFTPVATKHHCRNCGEGFCEDCSSHNMPVPKYGWDTPVRVCNNCYNESNNESCMDKSSGVVDDTDVRVRKYGEVVVNTLSSVFELPKGFIKDTARPSYWVPDHEITDCCVCKAQFGPKLTLHHCRDCGRGVCSSCSSNRKCVPKRNWEKPVRVCDECFNAD